jgi:hypothetical protein
MGPEWFAPARRLPRGMTPGGLLSGLLTVKTEKRYFGMRCAFCYQEFPPKSTRRRFSSDRCRAADWHRQRKVGLPPVERSLEP